MRLLNNNKNNKNNNNDNEMHKFIWDFEIKTDPLISCGRSDLIKKRKKKKK